MDINMIYIWYHKAATVTAINRIFIGLHTPRPLARQRMIKGENHGTPAAASIGRHAKQGRFFHRIFLYRHGMVDSPGSISSFGGRTPGMSIPFRNFQGFDATGGKRSKD